MTDPKYFFISNIFLEYTYSLYATIRVTLIQTLIFLNFFFIKLASTASIVPPRAVKHMIDPHYFFIPKFFLDTSAP